MRQRTANGMVNTVNGYRGAGNKAERPLNMEDATLLKKNAYGLYSWGGNYVTFAQERMAPRMCIWMMGKEGYQIGLEHVNYVVDFNEVVADLAKNGISDFRLNNGVSHMITRDIPLSDAIGLYRHLRERFPQLQYQ